MTENSGASGPPEACTRLSVYKETLWGPWAWTIDGLLLVVAYGDLAAKAFPSSGPWIAKVAFLSSLSWYWKLVLIFTANILLIGEGAFRAIRKREKQRDAYLSRLKEIENAGPNVVLRDPNAEYVELVSLQANGTIVGNVPFVKVRFVNKPQGNNPRSIAKQVRAKIKFYSLSGTLFLEMDGRWADSDQPSIRDFRKTRNDLLPIDFGIEEEHSLDIAFRTGTGEFVAWNNDNYGFPDAVKPEHVLPGEQFIVEIRLVGVSTDKTFSFRFGYETNEGVRIVRTAN